jgi:hypothetical protein
MWILLEKQVWCFFFVIVCCLHNLGGTARELFPRIRIFKKTTTNTLSEKVNVVSSKQCSSIQSHWTTCRGVKKNNEEANTWKPKVEHSSQQSTTLGWRKEAKDCKDHGDKQHSLHPLILALTLQLLMRLFHFSSSFRQLYLSSFVF